MEPNHGTQHWDQSFFVLSFIQNYKLKMNMNIQNISLGFEPSCHYFVKLKILITLRSPGPCIPDPTKDWHTATVLGLLNWHTINMYWHKPTFLKELLQQLSQLKTEPNFNYQSKESLKNSFFCSFSSYFWSFYYLLVK